MKTEAFVVEKPNAPFALTPVILREIQDDEYLIEMKYTGICHTDLTFQANNLPGLCDPPAIYGHEGAGIVRAAGRSVRNKSIQIGDPVLLSTNSCLDCANCSAGRPSRCKNSAPLNFPGLANVDSPATSKLDGSPIQSQFFGQSSLSRHSIVKEACVIKFPGAADEMGKFAACGCSFMTGAGTIMNVLQPGVADSIVVFGAGSVGLAAVMAAKYLQVCQIVVVDLLQDRLDLAKEVGATDIVNPTTEKSLVDSVKSLTAGGATFCVDCTGVPTVIEDMMRCLAPFGTAVSLGIPSTGANISIDPVSFIFENKRYFGVTGGDSSPATFIPTLVDMQRNQDFPVERLCKFYPHEDLEAAVADMRSGKAIKPVICWS